MKPRLCAADDCRKPFEPAFGQEQSQKYCSQRCATRMRVRICRARKRYGDDGGGGPGGRRQAALFSRSELHRRKPAKSAIKPKPKQDDLFPDDGAALYASFGGAVSYAQDGSVSDNARYSKYSVKSSRRPPQSASQNPEKPLAA